MNRIRLEVLEGKMKSFRLFPLMTVVLLVISSVSLGKQAHSVFAANTPTPFQQGDLFAGVGNGLVYHYDSQGHLLETLDTNKGNGVYTTGCASDSAGNLYVTTFNGGDVVRFSGPNIPHTNLGTYGSGYNGSPESIVFDVLGNFYVGAVDGDNDIRKFDPNGNLLAQYNVQTENRGSDWIDLAKDQRTMFYVSEGRHIFRFDVVDNKQLPDFTSSLPGSTAYALRILPDGSVLVADTEMVVLLDQNGNQVRTYDVPGEDSWFSLNLDPDGSSFWAGNFATGKFYKFDIANGGGPLLTVDTGVGSDRLFGICLFGEKTSALQDTDGDGLPDVWEEKGFDYNNDGTIDVDLPGMGAKKDHKDIFVYVDWLETGGLFGHSHKPSKSAIDKVVNAFKNAPVVNPDGTLGINIHIIFGKGITETTTNQTLGTVINGCDYNWTDFDNIKYSNFSREKWPIFHYVIFGHYLPKFQCGAFQGRPSGISRNLPDIRLGTSDFLITLADWEQQLTGNALAVAQAGTFMHELGHNLGLGHGGIILDNHGVVIGVDNTNYKPNYLSIMNYSFQTRGLREKGGIFNLFQNGNIDYSRFGPEFLPNLNESDLSEPDGIASDPIMKNYGTLYYCQGSHKSMTVDNLVQAVDWNCDGDKTDTHLSTDINQSENNDLSTLTTANEWPYLIFKGGAIGVTGVTPELPTVTSMADMPEITFDEDSKIGPYGNNLGPTLTIPDKVNGQYSDMVSFTVSASDPDNNPDSLTFTSTGLPNNMSITDNKDGTATISGILQVGPGTYTTTIKVTDPQGFSDSKPVGIIVEPEDARPTYTGPMLVSTGCADCSTATVPLRATIQDITAVSSDPAYDPYPGDITNATVTFVDRGNSNAPLCTASVILLDPTDPKVGTANCDWNLDLGNKNGVDYTIGLVVNGYYTRDSTEDDTVVVASKPTSYFITGGGYIINQNSGGAYTGDPGMKTNFGLNVKFNKKLTNLQGRVTLIVRKDNHVYQIKTNNLLSLVVVPFDPSAPDSGKAELVSKANITDVTDPLNPISIVGNAELHVTMKDNGEPGATDMIAVTLWSSNGDLLYSSNWDGIQTIEQVLDGGNMQVH